MITDKLIELNAQLEISSNMDSLCNIFNRRHIKKAYNDLQCKTKLALLVIDLDFFKMFNDTYGHIQGDKALVKVAEVLNEFQSQEVIFARYGGEEFVGIISYDDFETVIDIVTRINEKLSDRKIKHHASETGYLTISIGISRKEIIDSKEFEQLFTIADAELYKAKANGRNQYSVRND